MVQCNYCSERAAVLKRPKTGEKICKECFFAQFELEVHETIVANNLFTRGERVAIAASGGKDSTVLAHVLTLLNARYDYGLELFLLSIDEGIAGYRDDSLDSVKRNQTDYAIPLLIVGYKELYGWSMDDIVRAIGLKGNCTFCGVFRRQALDRGAVLLKADKMVTGHNCDDMAETVLMNLLRGDIARLQRCTHITTGNGEGGKSVPSTDNAAAASSAAAAAASSATAASPVPSAAALAAASSAATFRTLPRCKPFKYTYEKEIVLYAYYKHLDYFSTECIYSPNAYRGFARELLKEMEKVHPRAIVDIVRSGEHFLAAGGGAKGAEDDDDDEGRQSSSSSSTRAASSEGAQVRPVDASRNSRITSSSASSSRAPSRAGGGSGGGGGPGAIPRVTPKLGVCERCGYISSNRLCKACVLLEGLNRGRARIEVNTEEEQSSSSNSGPTIAPPASTPAPSASAAAPSASSLVSDAALALAASSRASMAPVGLYISADSADAADMAGRVATVQTVTAAGVATESGVADRAAASAQAAAASPAAARALAAADATPTSQANSGVSAAMQMAQKLNATAW